MSVTSSATRLKPLFSNNKKVKTLLTRFLDSVYNATVWTLVEPCIGMVCGCLPIVRGLLPAAAPTRKKSHLNRSRSSGYGHSRSPKPFRDSPGYIKMDYLPTQEPPITTVRSVEHVDRNFEEPGDGIMVRTRVEVVWKDEIWCQS